MQHAEHCFESMSVDHAQHVLRQMLHRVCHARTRVEIQDGPHAAVLISKEELQCLERALEILSNTAEVQQIAGQLASMTAVLSAEPIIAASASD